MKLKRLLELLTFLGTELLSSSLGMLCIDTCSQRPEREKKSEVSTLSPMVREASKPAFGTILKVPFFGSSTKETPASNPAEIMAAA